ncbi:hypothetical protein ACFXDH_37855 [Streptomyces sp. NPDC059467]|uniref:hypothetical protein n=1 Tax=Streptomyces sp. NPDC059467 TaxID=3346844 RepID=UPI0036819C77
MPSRSGNSGTGVPGSGRGPDVPRRAVADVAPRAGLRRLQLLVTPDAVLHRHRDLVKHRHARVRVNRPPGRPCTPAPIRRPVLRFAAGNPSQGYRRIHRELALPGIRMAPSTAWEFLKTEGIAPAPQRTTLTRADFLRSQARAILAMDFIETVTLTGRRQYILATTRHTSRRILVLGTTAHPTHTGRPTPTSAKTTSGPTGPH